MDMDEWTCRDCTLVNSGDMLNCNACFASRPRRKPRLPDVTNPEPIGSCYTRQGWSYGWYFDRNPDNERRLVLLGRTGSGKSATGNNILGRQIFNSSACGSSVTKVCQRGRASRFNRDIQIIDSPGLYDTGMSNAEITKEVMKCVGMTAPGPHAFVLVERIDRFTEEEQGTVEYFRQLFGRDILNYLIVLFTKKDDLQHHNKTLKEYLDEVPQGLHDLIVSCNKRCIAFNNRGSKEERDQDVMDLLDLVDQMFHDNGGRCYTSEMFVEAEKKMKMREEELRQEHEQKIKEERNSIRRQFELKLQMKHDEDADVEETEKAESEREAEKPEFRELMVMRKQLEDNIKTLDERIIMLGREKVDDAEKTVESEMDALSKQMKDLEIIMKRIKEVQQTFEADFREEARKEVNKGYGVMDWLVWALPSIVDFVVPTVKRFFKK